MTDPLPPLWDEARLLETLESHAQPRYIQVAHAYMLAGNMKDEYEMDRRNAAQFRTALEQTIATLQGEKVELAQEIAAISLHAADMMAAKVALAEQVEDYAERIVDLEWQRNNLSHQLWKALHPADVYITVGDTPYATSRFRTGMQDVDAGLRMGNQAARDKIAAVMDVGATHVMNFGAPNLWPDPAITDSSKWNWTRLDQRMDMFVEMGVEPALVLYNYPVWMKERVGPGGVVTPMDAGDPFATEGRVRRDMYGKLFEYCLQIGLRYMPPPYNVRTIVFGNEHKGDYIRRDGKPGYDIEEYTDRYNVFVDAMVDAANDSSFVSPDELRLGGSYAPIRCEATANKDTFPVLYPYGYYRRAPFEALDYWLKHAGRADFIAFDMGSGNAEGGELVDTFTVQRTKYADVAKWVRVMTDLPMIITELYPKTADDDNANPQRVAAAKLVAHLSMIEAGYEQAWLWGAVGQGEGNPPNGGLLKSYTTGETQPFYDAYKILHDHFTAGAELYPVTVEGEGVYAKANKDVVVAVNETGQSIAVSVGDEVVDLPAHEWLVRGR